MNYNDKFISIYLLNVILLESKILHLLSEIFQLRDKKPRNLKLSYFRNIKINKKI